MSSKIPAPLIRRINDERTRRLVHQVWQRLPAHDRAVLRALLSTITLTKSELGHTSLAYAGGIDPSLLDGNPAQAIEDLIYEVSLHRVPEVEADTAALFVIAHEFAHVVLRHPQIAIVSASLRGLTYSDDDLEAEKVQHEDEANLQVWAWGFQAEMRAFFDAYPESPRPRWDVDIETEG